MVGARAHLKARPPRSTRTHPSRTAPHTVCACRYELSVALKANREADSAYGWMLEMWGYSLAAARLGIKHFAWQQMQIEPSAAWHQDLKAQDPFIYHYTFGPRTHTIVHE